MEVDQHQQRGAVRRAERIERPNGRQRVVGARVDAGVVLTVNRQAAVDVPDDQPPVLVAAHLGDFGQGVFVLVGLNPQAGETGGDVLRQVLGKLHAKGLLDYGEQTNRDVACGLAWVGLYCERSRDRWQAHRHGKTPKAESSSDEQQRSASGTGP